MGLPADGYLEDLARTRDEMRTAFNDQRDYINESNQFKVGSFTRDTSLASGDQAVTGVGFQPKGILFFMGQSGAASNEASWGFTDASGGSSVLRDGTGIFKSDSSPIFDRQSGSGTQYTGVLDSFDADGFTITWTKAGSPTGTINIKYLAMR